MKETNVVKLTVSFKHMDDLVSCSSKCNSNMLKSKAVF